MEVEVGGNGGGVAIGYPIDVGGNWLLLKFGGIGGATGAIGGLLVEGGGGGGLGTPTAGGGGGIGAAGGMGGPGGGGPGGGIGTLPPELNG